MAYETTLDGAIHTHATRTPFARSLAGWRNALVEVQDRPESAVTHASATARVELLALAWAEFDTPESSCALISTASH